LLDPRTDSYDRGTPAVPRERPCVLPL